MRLCSLKNFRSLVYAMGSAPSCETLRQKIAAGKIPGGVIDDGRYYVDLDEYDREHKLTRDLLKRQAELSASPELQGLL